MIRRARLFSLAFAAVLPACGGETPPPEPPPPPPVTSAAPAPSAEPAPTASATASAAPTPPPPPPAPTAAQKYTGLSTPESVLYDADADRYLVSNINGKPDVVDNNGFISILSPDGGVTTPKWIEGGKKTKLNAPKGMALVKGVLYVSDITTVRMFDAKTGASKGEVAIPGSTFLNDLAAGPDGKVYVSDTGVKFGASGPEPTGTDAVYVIEKGHAKALAKGKELGGPNGLLVVDNGVVVVTFGSGEVYRLDDKGKKQDVSKPPKGMLDGVVQLGDSLLVTSWEGSAIYKGKLGGTFDAVLSDQKSPADIGYDTKRGRVLIPHFLEDMVEAYDLK
jgi:sugar lactone lactonase YvrE